MVETRNEGETQGQASDVAAMLSGAGWGLLVIWIGIVFLVGTPGWVALLGIGVITLGVQLVRRLQCLPMEGFWVVVGLLFVLGAVWDLSGTTVPLLPILLIVAGAALLLSIFAGRKKTG
jgi:hypothetical protein